MQRRNDQVPHWRTPEELVEIGFSRSRVVMMNEAHSGEQRCIRTRLIGRRLLPTLHHLGVRHLAMEALYPTAIDEVNRVRQIRGSRSWLLLCATGDGGTAGFLNKEATSCFASLKVKMLFCYLCTMSWSSTHKGRGKVNLEQRFALCQQYLSPMIAGELIE